MCSDTLCWNRVPHRGLKTVSCFDIWLATFHIIEMLYDTPFPDVPQSDLPVLKRESNAEIVARYQAGETGAGYHAGFRHFRAAG